MSKLNPNAGEWVPTFSAPVAVALPIKSSPSLVKEEKALYNTDTTLIIKKVPITAANKCSTPINRATESGRALPLDENGDLLSNEGYAPVQDRFIYSKEYLLAFQTIGDHVIKDIPEVVRNLTPLKFRPLYEMMPEDFTSADTIGAGAGNGRE
ncbi:unnamed protein product [Peronospora destructor]|uniref:Uncharacterized protein n=1 Tax=Peronospora destructor TaxID=86335 RepID=A0AAV0TPA2_9STRA|nr:unnamed protein product [Peronospora destructor]